MVSVGLEVRESPRLIREAFLEARVLIWELKVIFMLDALFGVERLPLDPEEVHLQKITHAGET